MLVWKGVARLLIFGFSWNSPSCLLQKICLKLWECGVCVPKIFLLASPPSPLPVLKSNKNPWLWNFLSWIVLMVLAKVEVWRKIAFYDYQNLSSGWFCDWCLPVCCFQAVLWFLAVIVILLHSLIFILITFLLHNLHLFL